MHVPHCGLAMNHGTHSFQVVTGGGVGAVVDVVCPGWPKDRLNLGAARPVQPPERKA